MWVETSRENQTRDLLNSMNRRTRIHPRSRHPLEGASALAITYYDIGILAYVFKPFAGLIHRAGCERRSRGVRCASHAGIMAPTARYSASPKRFKHEKVG